MFDALTLRGVWNLLWWINKLDLFISIKKEKKTLSKFCIVFSEIDIDFN
jgi:hypothetical protein